MINKQTDIVNQLRGSVEERHDAVKRLMNDAVLHKKIQGLVCNNSGIVDEAELVFDDTLLIFVKKVIGDSNFRLEHLHGYLLGVAKYVWMNQLRKRNRHYTEDIESVVTLADDTVSHDELIINKENEKLLNHVLSLMKQKCKEVLMYWANGFKMREIAERLSYTSDGAVRKKKSDCLKELNNYLTDHPNVRNQLKNTLFK